MSSLIGKPVFLYYDGRLRRGVVDKEGQAPGWYYLKFEGRYDYQHEYDFVVIPEEVKEMIPKYIPNYTCAVCLDPRQNETIPQEAEYVAIGNMPLYWCLCGKHYERLTVEQKTHYAKRSGMVSV